MVAGKCTGFAAAEGARVDELVRRDILDGLARLSPATTIMPVRDLFCSRERCDIERGGRLLYMDQSHLSADGAMLTRGRLGGALIRSLTIAGGRGQHPHQGARGDLAGTAARQQAGAAMLTSAPKTTISTRR